MAPSTSAKTVRTPPTMAIVLTREQGQLHNGEDEHMAGSWDERSEEVRKRLAPLAMDDEHRRDFVVEVDACENSDGSAGQ